MSKSVRLMFFRIVASAVTAALFLVAIPLSGQPNLRISGLDSGRLLTRNQIDLYVTVTDETGAPMEGLSQDDFAVQESPEGEHFESVRLLEFLPRANEEAGVTFQMLVDNSGSMYFSVDGEERDPAPGDMRITHAKSALRDFLHDIDNPLDRVGLASFNAFYTEHTEPTSETEVVDRLIAEIERPGPGEGYTELYASLVEMAEHSQSLEGRRVVILLSDGANYPVARHSGEPHPEYGEHIFTHEEAIAALNEQELTVYPIHFGTDQFDRYLEQIAEDTGGVFYDARTGDELSEIYEDIREQVLQEYLLTYRPSMRPAERRHVRVVYSGARAGPAGELSDTRSYVAGTLFGRPAPLSAAMLLIPLIAALLIWFLLTRLKLRNRRTDANFEVFGGGRTQVFPASGEKTVLGGGDADVTVVGPTGAASQEATVVFDEKRGTYTLSSASPVAVNNRAVTKRDLEPGDVIRLSGTIVVFDKPARKGKPSGGGDASSNDTDRR